MTKPLKIVLSIGVTLALIAFLFWVLAFTQADTTDSLITSLNVGLLIFTIVRYILD